MRNYSTHIFWLTVLGVLFTASSLSAQAIGLDELERMRTSTTPKIERGEQLYNNQGCVSCHGEEGGGLDAKDVKTNFAKSKFEYGGGLIQIYNFISFGKAESDHSVFGYLPYQDRWALAHYIRSLGPTTVEDPKKVVEQAKDMAKNGVCNPQTKKNLSEKAEPKGSEQMKIAKKVYGTNCSSCHGDNGKGNGPAAAALEPKPRNFHVENPDKWTKGTSPFAMFNVLKNGIEGTSMASFTSLSKKERWALVHYIREEWVPDAAKEEPSESAILETCRAMSSPAPPEPITVDQAMEAMTADYNRQERRQLQIKSYPSTPTFKKANAQRGEKVFQNYCSSCHGSSGQGSTLGPKGAQPPYLYIQVRPVVPEMAGGSLQQFVDRSSGGVHKTLPEMSHSATLTKGEWRDLQAYVAGLDSDADTKDSN